MARLLESHVCGRWVEGTGRRSELRNPTTEEVLAETSTEGVDFRAALQHARDRGGSALRELSFAQRGELLANIASSMHARRDELIELAITNGGNTRGDAKFDIDGATATLSAYAELGKSLGDGRMIFDGEPTRLSRSPRFVGRHVFVPRMGVAIHVNAFNFPAWGFGEKANLPLEFCDVGSTFEVDVRGRAQPARVVETPFYKRDRS